MVNPVEFRIPHDKIFDKACQHCPDLQQHVSPEEGRERLAAAQQQQFDSPRR